MEKETYEAEPPRPASWKRLPPVTEALVISCVVVFVLLQTGLGDGLTHTFALWPMTKIVSATDGSLIEASRFHVWQLMTYAFLHGNWAHLFLNLFGLWMFGSVMERTWGSSRYLQYFLVCVVGAAAVQIITLWGQWGTATIGASGGLFGVLLAFGMRYPEVKLIIFPIPFPVKARKAVVGIGALSLFMGANDWLPSIAHFTHLGGMVFGFLLIQYWRGKLSWKPTQPLDH